MKFNHAPAKLLGAGVLSALAASVCCIVPVLALLAGTSGLAANFSWIEPVRPYLMGFSIIVLGFAWYQKLKPIPTDECGCNAEEKKSFLQSKIFLLLITVFTLFMLTFPYYSKVFFPGYETRNEEAIHANTQSVEFTIKGMTCAACEEHVKHAVYKLPGVISAEVSYEKSNALVKFDATKTTAADIKKAINSTGYIAIQ